VELDNREAQQAANELLDKNTFNGQQVTSEARRTAKDLLDIRSTGQETTMEVLQVAKDISTSTTIGQETTVAVQQVVKDINLGCTFIGQETKVNASFCLPCLFQD
jgi:hypothetical protein